MGPSESEAKQTISVKDLENGSENSKGFGMLPAINVGEDDQITNSRTLSSSSSLTSSSSSGDPLEMKAFDQYHMGMNVGVPEHDRSCELVLEQEEDNNIPVSSMPWQEQKSSHGDHTLCLDSDFTKQFPSTQVMERPSTEANPSSSSYRIPSSVFDRTKSNTPIEWSVTSNDSLFSIYMGNTSFTRDHENWQLGKSEDQLLGLASDFTSESTCSGPLTDSSPSNHQHLINKPTEIELKTTKVDENESKSAETMREVIQENEAADYNKEKLAAKEPTLSTSPATKEPAHSPSPSLSHHSNCSGESVQSFAFPILTGDDKSYSLTHKQLQYPSSKHQSQAQTPKASQSPRKSQLQSQQLSQYSEPPTPKAETLTPKANPNGTHDKSWFSCFPRCSFCC